MKLIPFHTRIGIVGLAAAGKTVFLTSLIDHLKHFSPDRFYLGSRRTPATIRKFEELPLDPGQTRFDVEDYRAALSENGRWPRKTRSEAHFHCQFELSHWWFSWPDVHCFDFAGDRMADVLMVDRDFAAWSDMMWKQLNATAVAREQAQPFLDAIDAAADRQPDDEALLRSYREALIGMLRSYRHLITPSTFLITPGGQAWRNAQQLRDQAYTGLTDATGFTPLPEHARKRWPSLAKTFARRYQRYHDELARPFARFLRRCDQLVILVDIPTLLMSGPELFNDNQRILEMLVSTVDPSAYDTFTKLWDTISHDAWTTWWGGRPKRVAKLHFVATKADLVHADDRDRLLALLEQFTQSLRNRTDLPCEHHICAAIASTRSLPTGELEGRPLEDPQGTPMPPSRDTEAFRVSRLPDRWPETPEEWSARQYSFPEVWPEMPAIGTRPPNHINLDRVLERLLHR